MSKTSMREGNPFYPFALEAGGSHYPGVGGDVLHYYGRLIAEECARIAREGGDIDTSSKILERFELVSKHHQ